VWQEQERGIERERGGRERERRSERGRGERETNREREKRLILIWTSISPLSLNIHNVSFLLSLCHAVMVIPTSTPRCVAAGTQPWLTTLYRYTRLITL